MDFLISCQSYTLYKEEQSRENIYIDYSLSNQHQKVTKKKIKIKNYLTGGEEAKNYSMFDLHFQVVLIIVPKGTRPECQVFFVIGVDIGCSDSRIKIEKIVP